MHINRQCRLRVVPLSPSPSSKTRKKTTRKNGRARSAIFFSRISFASRSRCLPVLPHGEFAPTEFVPTSTHLVITYFKFIFFIPKKREYCANDETKDVYFSFFNPLKVTDELKIESLELVHGGELGGDKLAMG